MIINGSPNSTGWPSSIRIWITVPLRGEGIWFMVFIASTMSSVSPASHPAADLDEGPRARLGPDIGGADHGRRHHAGMLGGIERRGDGERRTAAAVARGARSGAATTACAWRATRTRWPSRSNSISVSPVSSRSCASSRISVVIDRGLVLGRVLALALAGHAFSPFAARRSSRPAPRLPAHSLRSRSRTGWPWPPARCGNDDENSRARRCC